MKGLSKELNSEFDIKPSPQQTLKSRLLCRLKHLQLTAIFGNHSLSIIEIPEDYDSLTGALTDIVQEASELQSIEVN